MSISQSQTDNNFGVSLMVLGLILGIGAFISLPSISNYSDPVDRNVIVYSSRAILFGLMSTSAFIVGALFLTKK